MSGLRIRRRSKTKEHELKVAHVCIVVKNEKPVAKTQHKYIYIYIYGAYVEMMQKLICIFFCLSS
ncbi:hypothetical protein LguiB_023677 [Lonicera macranthoides]